MAKGKNKAQEPELSEKEMSEQVLQQFQGIILETVVKYAEEYELSTNEVIHSLVIVMSKVTGGAVEQEMEEAYSED